MVSCITINDSWLYCCLCGCINYCMDYHLIITLPQVKPLPNAARTTVSPFFIFPCSQASVSAIGMDAAVVFPYFWMLLKT